MVSKKELMRIMKPRVTELAHRYRDLPLDRQETELLKLFPSSYRSKGRLHRQCWNQLVFKTLGTLPRTDRKRGVRDIPGQGKLFEEKEAKDEG